MKKILIFNLTVIILFINGCLDDKSIPLAGFQIDDSAKILEFLESQGDFPNTDEAPGLVTPQDIFNTPNNYCLLDIRDHGEFIKGHIKNSCNVIQERLFEIVDSVYTLDQYKRIAIISKNGQASAYFTCLLRLAGFENVFSLKYGMAYWNIDFSEEWLDNCKNEDDLSSYENKVNPKLALTSLPKLDIPISLKTPKEKTLYRIKQVIKKGFWENINYITQLNSNIKLTHIKICYGPEKFYIYPPRDLGAMGHPVGTIWYVNHPNFEFRSIESLQSLPTDSKIIIYTGDGQLGACITAYLTLLGYDIKNLLFGANQLFYTRMRLDPILYGDAFKPEEIANYPYVIGN